MMTKIQAEIKKKWDRKRRVILKKTRTNSSRKMKAWKEKLKKEGRYQKYLDYRREWTYRKRHSIPGRVDYSIPRVEIRTPQVHRNKPYPEFISSEFGNRKWKELLEEDRDWKRNHKNDTN